MAGVERINIEVVSNGYFVHVYYPEMEKIELAVLKASDLGVDIEALIERVDHKE